VQRIHTFGVAKAYDTKVGTHTFLTQMDDAHPLAIKLKQIEFGTSTGRQRMVGWFDAVEKGDALRYGGFQDVMINKSDALTHSGEWNGELSSAPPIQDASGKIYHHVPRNEAVRKTLKPVYTHHAGWTEDISKIRHFAELPLNAQRYVAAMMKATLDVAYAGAPPVAKLLNCAIWRRSWSRPRSSKTSRPRLTWLSWSDPLRRLPHPPTPDGLGRIFPDLLDRGLIERVVPQLCEKDLRVHALSIRESASAASCSVRNASFSWPFPARARARS